MRSTLPPLTRLKVLEVRDRSWVSVSMSVAQAQEVPFHLATWVDAQERSRRVSLSARAIVLPPEIVRVLEFPAPEVETVWLSVLSSRLVRSAVLPPEMVRILLVEFQETVWASVSVSMSVAQAQEVPLYFNSWLAEQVVIKDTW